MITNGITLQSRGWKWSTVDSDIINSSALCGKISGTGKMNDM